MTDYATVVRAGRRIAYEVYGSGDQVVVYLHGLLLDANLNRPLAHALAEHGHRVVLVDLPGHGRSDKPKHASAHRMDAYADDVVALLDDLGVDNAVIGGVSLGANVALHVAVRAPERVRGLVIEMPVLEWATPGAAMVFVPLLLAVHYAAPVVRALSGLVQRLPRTRNWAVEGVRAPFTLDPDELTAVLHGLLVGPVAPTVEQRRAVTAPALVIGHRADFIHPFSDAENLVRQLPSARLVQAHSAAELRLRPGRLTGQITSFLDEVFARPVVTSISETARPRRRR